MDNIDVKEFGIYLKHLREERNLTTYQVELYAKVSNSYLSLLENGRRGIPSPKILKKLAPIYKVPYEELMKKAGYFGESIEELIEPDGAENSDNIHETDDLKEFAQHFTELRIAAGFQTTDDLAKAAGVWTFTIKRIESGKNKMPSPPILEKLAKPLGIAPEELIEAAGYVEYEGGWIKALDDLLRPTDFDKLSPEEQKNIRDQIDFYLSRKNNK